MTSVFTLFDFAAVSLNSFAPGSLQPPASIPSPPSPILFSVGGLTVRWYAVWILTGMVVAILWSAKRWRARGGNPELVGDVGLWSCLFGIVGARAMSVVSYPEQYFAPGTPWWKPFAIWEGGLAIYGGLIGGAITIVVMVRRRGLPVGVFFDAMAPTILVAQALGRLGNYFNQEVFGSPTTLPWGLQIDAAHLPSGTLPGTLFHPTFLYEALWNLASLGLILAVERWAIRRQKLGAWQVAGSYLLLYSLGRFLLEFVRIDFQNTIAGGIRWFQAVAGLGVLIGLFLLTWASRRHLPYRVLKDSPDTALQEQAKDAKLDENHPKDSSTKPPEESDASQDTPPAKHSRS